MAGLRLSQSTTFWEPPDKKAVNARIHSKTFGSLKFDIRTTERTGTNGNLNRNWNFVGRGKIGVNIYSTKSQKYKIVQ
jgi:hypothetical protein